MKRDDVVSLAAAVVILLALVVAWVTNASGALGLALSGMMGGTGAVLLMRAFRKYEDERLVHIRNLSTRNVSVFVILALPLTGAALVVLGADCTGIAALYILWFLSLGVMYFSGVYYYKK